MGSTSIAGVIVTYNPNPWQLEQLLTYLLPQVDFTVIVDNGSENQRSVRATADRHEAKVFPLSENLGIAAAQNMGIQWAMGRGATHVLLSDQDSIPKRDMVKKLLACLENNNPETVAAVGPVPVDSRGDGEDEREDALVYSFTTWGPKRREIPTSGEVLEVPFVLASGSLLPVAALRAVGPMNESLFIDHVDLAWCLRAVEMGYRILVCGDATLRHSLGENKMVLPGGREVHVQSPARNYYMVRNTLYLMRAPFMPLAWKVGYLPYLTKYLGFYALASIKEKERAKHLLKGLRDGLFR